MTEKPDALSAAAKAIADNAGLEPAYADLKDHVPKSAFKASDDEMINDDDPGITYSGPWEPSGGRLGDYNGDVHFTKQTGATATFDFTGSGIDFFTETNNDEGDVAISIDGTLVQTINCQSPEREMMKVVFHTDWPQEGKHQIKIEKKSGDFLLLDAFGIYHRPTR